MPSSTQSQRSNTKNSEKESGLISHACSLRFHQSFKLSSSHPENPLPGTEFRVSYGVSGHNADELVLYGDSLKTQPAASEDEVAKTPTVLVMGGMFCSRYWLIHVDRLARVKGVRVVYVDRPGLGASSSVPLPQRLEIWLNTTLPLVLKRLKIKHCVFMSHSSGTNFMLNTLFHFGKEFLSLSRPYIAFFAPWVHPSHSGMAVWRYCASPMLPTGILNYWSGLQGFVVKNVMPSMAWSGGLLNALSPPASAKAEEDDPDSERARREAAYGLSTREIEGLEKIARGFSFEESHKGGNDEAMLCLKKLKDPKTGQDKGWGVADNYETFVTSYKQQLRDERASEAQVIESRKDNFNGAPADGKREAKKHTKLSVEAYFASSDIMIGDKGTGYFKNVFQDKGGDDFDFESFVIEDTNHDSVFFPSSLAFDRFFDRVLWSLSSSSPSSALDSTFASAS